MEDTHSLFICLKSLAVFCSKDDVTGDNTAEACTLNPTKEPFRQVDKVRSHCDRQ